MMKILVLTSKPPWPACDGGAVATQKMIEGMLSAGAEISLLSMTTEKHRHQKNNNGLIPGLTSWETVSINTKITVRGIISNLLFSGEPYDLIRFFSADFAARLESMLKEKTFDIIHCEGLVFTYYLPGIRKITSSPIVLRAHNVEHRIRKMMAGNSRNLPERFYLNILAGRLLVKERKAAGEFDAVVTISTTDQQWFTEESKGKPVITVYPGFDNHQNTNKPLPDRPRIGFLGALDWKPNTEGLLWFVEEVWPEITKKHPSASFHIAGKNCPEGIKKRVTGKNIFFEGEVPDSGSFISSMTLMIAPLFAGSGIRIKILEAMYFMRPVVATAAAAEGIPLSYDELLIADDSISFAGTINAALNNPASLQKTSDAASRLIREHFDNSRQAAKLLALYSTMRHDS